MMTHNGTKWLAGISSALFMMVAAVPSGAVITSGSNLDAPTVGPIVVPWDSQNDHFEINEELYFDPNAGPMIKVFETPPTAPGTTGPILPGSAFPIWENWRLTVDPRSAPVSDWHEEIITPGWEWLIPGDTYTDPSGQPKVWDPNGSLITKDGQPWPWDHIPHPGGGSDPTKLWVDFPPIFPGEVLDIHKALIWVGTANNSVWGDGEEFFVEVREYPTPEPASLALVGLGSIMLFRRRRS